MAKELKLTQGYVATVDDEDFERVSKLSWCVLLRPNGVVHAMTKIWGLTVFLHNFVLRRNGDQHKIPDHINGNGLDNRKENLVVAGRRENALNSDRSRRAKLVERTGNKWVLRVTVNKKRSILGTYTTEAEALDAAREYKSARETQHNSNCRGGIR